MGSFFKGDFKISSEELLIGPFELTGPTGEHSTCLSVLLLFNKDKDCLVTRCFFVLLEFSFKSVSHDDEDDSLLLPFKGSV